ncbi:MAG: multidrug transporter [Solobacterium sp.]|jgi:hypothetical protein|nr:multidrug transporter [Solobacterium sp.]MCH4223135.1 multidrug transporter [Solobacterium sp.]MCH4266534.1 multidrug transporter [Solobacterium sp.]
MMECSKQDWNLYREKLKEWQERYMARLDQEYIELLQSDQPASSRFWALNQRIQQDQKKTGVQAELKKSTVVYQLAELLSYGAITEEDLAGFSEELLNRLDHFRHD